MKEMDIMDMIATSFAANLLASMFFSFMAFVFAYLFSPDDRKLLGAATSLLVTMLMYMATYLIFNPIYEAYSMLVIGLISLFAGIFAVYILVDLYPPWGGPGPSVS